MTELDEAKARLRSGQWLHPDTHRDVMLVLDALDAQESAMREVANFQGPLNEYVERVDQMFEKFGMDTVPHEDDPDELRRELEEYEEILAILYAGADAPSETQQKRADAIVRAGERHRARKGEG